MAVFAVAFLSLLSFAMGATHTVGFNNAPVWTVGIGVSYPDVTIPLGKTISFTSSNTHDVVLLTPPSSGTPWDLCTMTGIASSSRTTIFATSDFAVSNSEKHYTPPTCGDYFLACSVSAHCAYGQRMKVTVTNVDGSACSSPCSDSACITTASKQSVTGSQNVHAVAPALPAMYWGVAFYDDLTVNMGDTVVFKTGAGHHDVAIAPDSTSYNSCTTSSKTLLAEWDGSGNISSTCVSSSACCAGNACGKDGMYATYTYKAETAGEVYFICSIGGGSHCQQGQKFKLVVNSGPTTHTVGFNTAPVWTVGIGVSYPDVTITLGKTLSFTSSNTHDVVLLTPPSSGTPWDLCTMTGIASSSRTTVFATSDFAASNSEKHYTPPTCGDYYLACSVSAHCAYGQRIKVTVSNVDGSACSSPCSGSACITTASKQTVTGSQNVHAVAPALPAMYWGVAFYDDLTVNIGDTVLFKTGAGHHDVAIAPDSTAYSSCTTASKTALAEWDGSGNISSTCVSSSGCCSGNTCGKDGMYATYTYTAETAGEVYFICSVGGGSHCQQGQKFKLVVKSGPTTHTVGFNTAPVWTVGIGVSYPDMSITLGKTLSFTSSNTHDVVLLTPPSSGTPWNLCTMTGIAASSRTTVFATSDFAASNSEKHYTPPTCGDYYLACSVSAHCAYGQRMKVTVSNVDGSACASPCVGIACVTAASQQTVATSQNVHAASPALPAQYWGVAFYNDMTVNIGDSVIFKTGAGHHDVATAPDASAFGSCSTSSKVVLANWDISGNISSTCVSNSACCTGNSCAKDGMFATYTYTATAAGEVYFMCSIGGGMHCQQGQKFKLTVKATASSTTLAGMSTTTQDASGATTSVIATATTADVASISARVVAEMWLSFAPVVFAFGFFA